MKSIKFISMTFFVAVIASGCALQKPTQLNFIPIDQNKYQTAEALQAGLMVANKKCNSVSPSPGNTGGLNAISAGRAEMEDANGASYIVCMGENGFIQKQ